MINVVTHIRKVCKKKIIFPLICTTLFLFSLVALILSGTLFPQNKSSIWDINHKNKYVTTTADKLYYTGYNIIKLGSPSYGYYYALENDKCIFVLIPIDTSPKEVLTDYKFTAKISNANKSYKEMLSSFANDLGWTADGISSISAQFILSQADYHPIFAFMILWIVIISLLISLKKLIPILIYLQDPLKYPICSYKSHEENKRLIKLAESELCSNVLFSTSDMFLTEHYFIDLSKNQAIVIPLRRVVWCYRMGVTTVKNKMKVPEFTLFFTLRDGSLIYCKHKTSENFLQIIKNIESLKYNIIIGYSEKKRKEAKSLIKK